MEPRDALHHTILVEGTQNMLAKLAALAQSKTAIAVMGLVLVGGGSGAVAVAATTGHLKTLGVDLSVTDSKTPEAASSETPDSHAHSIGVEGLLTACSATTAPATLSVTDHKGKSWSFVVSATTKFNGEESGANGGASTAKGDNSVNGGASTAKGDNSTSGGDASEGPALTLANICAATNHDVQVQATLNGTEYDAWKVTLQGREGSTSSSEGSSTGASSDKGSSSDSSQQSSTDSKSFEGTASAVSATGFTLTSHGVSYQVVFTATTHVSGAASLGAIAANAQVSVEGTLSGTTITAAFVEVSAPDSSTGH